LGRLVIETEERMARTKTMALCVALAAMGCGGGGTTGDAGSGGGDGGVSIETACSASAAAQCTMRDTCSVNHYGLTRTYGDMATCVQRMHDSCVAGLNAPGTGNTPANVMACVGALATTSCTDFQNGNVPAPCLPPAGTVAMGGACRFNAQCTTTYCNITTGSECGTCGALPTAGTACEGPAGVAACGGHGMVCVGATAVPYAAGTCQMLVTATGTACDATHPCGAGLSCTPVSTTAANRTCEPAGSMVGAACNGATNPGCDVDRGLTCNSMTHMCAQFGVVAAGTACGVGADGTFVHCASNGVCMGYTTATPHGTCIAAAADGSACDRSLGPSCATGSACVGAAGTTGMCIAPNAMDCH
jgi:hypothetical protein